MKARTFVILFLLGFFISCSSNRDVVKNPEDKNTDRESIGSLK
jgi:hypothetical protein